MNLAVMGVSVYVNKGFHFSGIGTKSVIAGSYGRCMLVL